MRALIHQRDSHHTSRWDFSAPIALDVFSKVLRPHIPSSRPKATKAASYLTCATRTVQHPQIQFPQRSNTNASAALRKIKRQLTAIRINLGGYPTNCSDVHHPADNIRDCRVFSTFGWTLPSSAPGIWVKTAYSRGYCATSLGVGVPIRGITTVTQWQHWCRKTQ